MKGEIMDSITKARINLFAVLRNLEDLCDLDLESKEIIKDSNIGIEFHVPEVGRAILEFRKGKCKFTRVIDGKKQGAKAALQLFFTSPEHFNKLIDGEKTVPIFFNIFAVGFLLKQFTKLTDRMVHFLQPKPEEKEELLKDEVYFKINTTLTAYTAFFAMAEIANSDFIGRAIARRMPDCSLQCGVEDGFKLTVDVKNHEMAVRKGGTDKWYAEMIFADLQFAHDLLNGNTSSFTGMGTGKFKVRGAVEILEQMAKLLSQVGIYLA